MIIFGLQGRLCVEGSWYSSGTQQVHVVVWAVRFNRPIMAANDIGPARAASPSIGGSGGSGGAGQGGCGGDSSHGNGAGEDAADAGGTPRSAQDVPHDDGRGVATADAGD